MTATTDPRYPIGEFVLPADPAHVDARVMAAVALTLLARYDEAAALIEQTRPLAPDHPFVTLLGVIVAGMSGDKERATALLDDYGRRVRDPKLKEALPVVAELFGILPDLRKNFQAVLAGDQAAFVGLVMKLGPNTANPARRSASPTPATSGASGPMTTRSIARSRASSVNCSPRASSPPSAPRSAASSPW